MSHQTGIKPNDQLRTFVAKSKDGHTRMFKVIINNNEELALDIHRDISGRDWQSDYNQCVLKVLDQKNPCYIFYRLDERVNADFSWLFITYIPDNAPVKLKMLYAATKSTLKLEFGAGHVKEELFGTNADDVSLEGYLKHLRSQAAPAPLTYREEEMEILKQSENRTKINVDSKQKTMQGVMFPIEQRALEKIDMLRHHKLNYVQIEIDIKNEKILLDRYKDHLQFDQLRDEIPNDKGRFHLFRFDHQHEGEQFNQIIFIYSMPGFICSVKERMLYSSCKSEFLQYLKANLSIDISKTFEISEPSELTYQALIDELHPKRASDGLKFEKPKGPTSRGPKRVTRPADSSSSNTNEFHF
jgi:twinfilin-like protein